MNILNWPDWEVTNVTEEAGIRVVSASYKPAPTACIRCGSLGTLEGGPRKIGTYQQRVHDQATLGKPTIIAVRRQRYQCRDCKATFSQPLPDVTKKGTMTTRLADWIKDRSIEKTFTSVAEEAGVTEGTVRNLFREYIAYLDANVHFQTPTVLGIDELHLMGQARCIMTNVAKRTVIEMLPTRTKDAVYRRLVTLPDRSNVRYVCMDMWPAYRDAARAVWPDITVIVDKYHVVRLASQGLERVRKDIRASLSDKLRRNMMHDRFILLKRRRSLNERESLLLDTWVDRFPTLKIAYEQKEAFYDLFDATITSAEARERYAAWKSGLTTEIQPPFKDLTTALANWDTEIFSYFDHRVTNAYTEALNGLAKLLNRNGRGYSFEVIRAKVLYSRGTHLNPSLHVNESLSPTSYQGWRLVTTQGVADGSLGASISTLMEMIRADMGDDESTPDYE